MARTKSQIQPQMPFQEKDPNATAAIVEPHCIGRRDIMPKAPTSKKAPPEGIFDSPKENEAPKDESAPTPKSTKKESKPEATTASSLSSIPLEGEDSESVPIFQTCDDVRKEINTYLTNTKTTKAAFARELNELLPNSKLTSRNLDQLLKMKGPAAGGHNIAFYAAYVFFEKIRIHDGKKKSARRQKMEEIYDKPQTTWGSGASNGRGFPREGSHNKHCFLMAGEKARLDQYGQMQIKGEPSSGAIRRGKVKN